MDRASEQEQGAAKQNKKGAPAACAGEGKRSHLCWGKCVTEAGGKGELF